MIQYGEQRYKKDLICLWKTCFPQDSVRFIDFYFDRVYKYEENLIVIEGGEIISSLQMIPYSVKIKNTVNLAGYISGAMTHPDFQKKGYMAQLLNEAFEQMREKSYLYTFLIPQEKWLFAFYEKYGFQKAFPDYQETNMDFCERITHSSLLINKKINLHTKEKEVDVDDFYIIYSRFLMEKENVILKTKPQLANILWDLFEDSGVLLYNDLGCAFIYPEEKKVTVKEFFYCDEEVKREFLYLIMQNYPEKRIIIQNNPNAPFLTWKGMIKNLQGNVEKPADIYMSMMID